jgi:hypothetical protein
MRLAAIASALAIVLCVAIFGAILLQKTSLSVPSPAPPQATPTEGRSPGSVATVADSAAKNAAAAPAAVDQASPAPTAPAAPWPSAMPTSCSNPNAIGVSRVVEIDTTGGPGFGFEHFKAHDFLREGEVVLTFDDGPWPKNTPAVLAALAAHCTKAIFFPIGLHATYEPGILKQVAAAGHAVGSHTWCHQDLSKTKGKCNVNGKVQTVEYNPIDEIEMGISAVHDFQHATAEAAMDLLNDLKAGGYKIVFMQPKYSVTTIASYDEAILKQLKGPMTDARPTSSVVRTISE